MKELKNLVAVTGQLVKIEFDDFVSKKTGDAMFGGSLVLRTADGSEHEVRYVTGKYKKDDQKRQTSEESYFYKQYLDAKEKLKDIEHCSEGESPDVVSITDGYFIDNDFKGKNGSMVSSNKINGRFINKIEPKDYDSTILEAKFELEGIIDSIQDEISKGELTGNLAVKFLAFSQIQEDYKDPNSYELDHLVPVELIVDKSMVDAFKAAGYYEGCFTKFVGRVINKAVLSTVREKAAFGTDIVKQVKSYTRKNEIKSGTDVSTIYEHGITQESLDALKAKRKAKLAEIESVSSTNTASGFAKPKATAPTKDYNPFK